MFSFKLMQSSSLAATRPSMFVYYYLYESVATRAGFSESILNSNDLIFTVIKVDLL